MRSLILLAAALSMAGTAVISAQTAASHVGTVLVGADYTWLHTNIVPGCNCVQLNGGGLQLEAGFLPHVAAVADLNITHKGGITPDHYTLTHTIYGFGLRYIPLSRRARLQPFGEALLGGAYASGSLAPDRTGFGQSTALAVEAGGGLRMALSRPLGGRILLQPVRADYVYTTFGNGANNRQNDVRLSAGLLVRLSH